MVERDEAAEAAAKRSWRSRRRVKRLFLGWFIVSLVFAEAGASWFGIFLALHAPMSMADAKLIGERIAMTVLLVSFIVLLVAIGLQSMARRRLRQLERAR
jgi:threonine/homoserine/homoserine lactone efflux protein